MKLIPNCISFLRIILSVLLLYFRPLSLLFHTIYIICGLTDIMDGYIARKMGATSRFGARLDSIADLVMVGVILIKYYPIVKLTDQILIWIIAISILRLGSITVAYIKFKTFAILHTYGNKFTGIVLFVFVILYPHINNTTVLAYVICIVASLSSIEELIIQVSSNKLQLNKRSIFL